MRRISIAFDALHSNNLYMWPFCTARTKKKLDNWRREGEKKKAKILLTFFLSLSSVYLIFPSIISNFSQIFPLFVCSRLQCCLFNYQRLMVWPATHECFFFFLFFVIFSTSLRKLRFAKNVFDKEILLRKLSRITDSSKNRSILFLNKYYSKKCIHKFEKIINLSGELVTLWKFKKKKNALVMINFKLINFY